MLNPSGKDGSGKESSPQSAFHSPLALSLPKGGGAIRGIGEKFGANPVTGAAAMSVPIPTSPGRSGLGPQLTLSYDSGAGNGPFGFGWTLPLPAITRKSDKGLPRYHDAAESDVFILSGAEDLAPEYQKDGTGQWIVEDGRYIIFDEPRTVGGVNYRVRRYRPRVEGLFARIEQWTDSATGEIHWRSISQGNVTTLYGKDNNSRIFDPADPNPDHPTCIFSWLICQSYDDKGNAIVYEYAAEDAQDVDLAQANERNRVRTAHRYLKHIRYGNRTPNRDEEGRATDPATLPADGWMFQVVFDYGEHDEATPRPDDARVWQRRADPFSSFRAGFEVRLYRLCQRVLMFHHFPGEPGVGPDCLVRSTDFTYAYEREPQRARNPVYTFIAEVTHSGYRREGDGYRKRSMPPVSFEYSQPIVQEVVETVNGASLENLPVGLDGGAYQWTDLHGEGIPGILTEQGGAWFYKRNLSPISPKGENGGHEVAATFAPLEVVATKPALSLAGQGQFMDLAGDGLPDLVVFDGPLAGLYEHDEGEGWQPFRPFVARLNRDTRDPNLKFVDLDGDGHADVLITEDELFVWHPSRAEAGFGPAWTIHQAGDEESGPRLLFADGSDSIYLADLSGDGLTDLVRVRNGEVCYWPNLGYGRFGPRVAMDNAPHFDTPDQFDQKRVRLADVDGSGTTDIIYLHRDGVRLYFNQSGNSWSEPATLNVFPRVNDLATIIPVDLLGNGTACLVWSSPLAGDAPRPMRYVNLMGGQKPHLLVKCINNLGAETHIHYAPSTKFYLADKYAGKPWVTRLPFPVHVVERVETYDRISRNLFASRYTYHHGYFDGEEREFRGFAMVEQWDSEEFNRHDTDAANGGTAWQMPPVHTKSWYHTGAYVGGQEMSRQLARDYYGAPADAAEFERWRAGALLPDTVMPGEPLSAEEERQACRALKGMMVRREVYADDGSTKAALPYTIAEQNFTVVQLQPKGENRHAVFFAHPREAITYHTERNPADPRVQHALTLEVDPFGNVRKSLAIAYGRRPGVTALEGEDKRKQEETRLLYAENDFTVPDESIPDGWADAHRLPLPCETRSYEITGFALPGGTARFTFEDFAADNFGRLTSLRPVPYETPAAPATPGKRLVECVRTLYRRDDLAGFLELGRLQSLALPGESYRLALTPSLVAALFQRQTTGEALLPQPGALLEGAGPDEGAYVAMDGSWWIPSGQIFYSPAGEDAAAAELVYARRHFFLPHRFRDPFGGVATLLYDGDDGNPAQSHNLLAVETRDALGNTVQAMNDYRVLQPSLVVDANGNRAAVAYDTLGLVAGTAVMGKAEEPDGRAKGDLLDGTFQPDPTQSQLDAFLAQPRLAGANGAASVAAPVAHELLGKATTRIVYDLHRYRDTVQSAEPQPAFAATIAREKHVAELAEGEQASLQMSFGYSDGFGREIQRKIQAEPGPLVEGGPVVNPRWVGSGWTIFNNKGKPVRQYEPFFSRREGPGGELTGDHRFEYGVQVGVSPTLFYDPLGRVVATLHPNHTWDKVVFDPWQQVTYDVNDTLVRPDGESDPSLDPDVGLFFQRLPDADYLPTWYEQRQSLPSSDPERAAAGKAAAHANTPEVAHFDALGRPFLTLAHNGFDANGEAILYATRVELDIEGNQRAVVDANGRTVMRYDFDMLGSVVHQASMEAGERWLLNDAAGRPIRAWDSRGFARRMSYDELRRPTHLYVAENGPERLVEYTVYGESQGDAHNHRTRIYQVADGAGLVTAKGYDFKGNPLESQRDLLPGYKEAVDWAQNPTADDGIYTSHTAYDALNRPTAVTTPDGTIYRPTFSEANLLDKVDANLRGEQENGQPKWTSFVTNVDYDAKGQRQRIALGNGAQTTYEYDPLTYRLVRLKTTRQPGQNGLAPIFARPTVVQELSYTYDPAGNIIRIKDAALSTVFHSGQIEPLSSYSYDPLYRLIEARGREHIGQMAFVFQPGDGSYRDHPFAGSGAHPNDLQALRTYTQQYNYDPEGNLLQIRHQAAGGNWRQSYDYEEASLLEPGVVSNRLTRLRLGNGASHSQPYTYDAHGNMTSMAHLPSMLWDFNDRLRATMQQTRNDGTAETTYYVYDGAGQRVRKVTENQNGKRVKERIYLGGYELYREYNGNGQTVALERETLHVMDDQQRIALVETKTSPAAGRPLVRYQLGNHLGSASVELDQDGALLSYEEYHPCGTTAFQARASAAEVSLKRYRYTGKERDEESGFTYHGARYYAPWLGRWTSCDPAGMADGPNSYQYVRSNPVNAYDPTGTEGITMGEVTIIGRPDKRTEEEVAKEISRLTGKSVSDLLYIYYGTPMVMVTMKELENLLYDKGILKDALPTKTTVPVMDYVLEQDEYAGYKYRNRVAIGSEDSVDRAKAAGLQEAVDVQMRGLMAGAAAARRGSHTKGVGAPFPDLRSTQSGAPVDSANARPATSAPMPLPSPPGATTAAAKPNHPTRSTQSDAILEGIQQVEAFEAAVRRVEQNIRANPDIAWNKLTAAEQGMVNKSVWFADMNYGKAFERLLWDELRQLGTFDYIANAKGFPRSRADFADKPGVGYGLWYDATTYSDLARHKEDRWYSPRTVFGGYQK